MKKKGKGKGPHTRTGGNKQLLGKTTTEKAATKGPAAPRGAEDFTVTQSGAVFLPEGREDHQMPEEANEEIAGSTKIPSEAEPGEEKQIPHDRRPGISNSARFSGQLWDMAAGNNSPPGNHSTALPSNVGAEITAGNRFLPPSDPNHSGIFGSSGDSKPDMAAFDDSLPTRMSDSRCRRGSLEREHAEYLANGGQFQDFDEYRRECSIQKRIDSLQRARQQHAFQKALIKALGPMINNREKKLRKRFGAVRKA